MPTSISRHFVSFAGRQTHYRRAGQGAPVLLLHQSPNSSRECETLMRRLAPNHSVFAPDMPGYGASDPMGPQTLTVEMLADNVAHFMDALGIRQAGIYGFHTGASIAVAFARHHPKRVSVAVGVGLLCLEGPERQELLCAYTPPFVPQWDGSHLSWLWSRLKDQSLFFPWYARAAANRLTMDGSTPLAIQASVRDWLRCGERYRDAYQAAFRYEPQADLAHIVVPHFILDFPSDPLFGHLERLPALRKAGSILRYATAAEAESAACDLLQRYPGAPSEVPGSVPGAPPGSASRCRQEYLTLAGIQLRMLRADGGLGRGADPGNGGDLGDAQPPVLLLHGAQSSATACQALLEGFATSHSVVALELPGHGESDPLPQASDYTVESLAELYGNALSALGMTRVVLVGIEAGASIQAALAVSHRVSVEALHLLNAIDVAPDAQLRERLLESYPPQVAVDFFGGHLLRAWHEARDHALFFPWYERRRECAPFGEALLETALVHRQAVDTILSGAAGHAIRRAEIRFPLAASVLASAAALHCRPCLAAPASSARFMATKSAASACQASFRELPRDARRWAETLHGPA